MDQEPDIRNQEPEVRNQEPEVRNQEAGVRNQEPGAAATGRVGSLARSRERVVGNPGVTPSGVSTRG